MGSAALFEAARSIRDWSLNEGRSGTPTIKPTEVYASLVFITYVPKAVLWLPKMFY